MTAPGVGVGGGIRPPGIPSGAAMPRGFSSLSHERDAAPHGDACGSGRRGLRSEDSASPVLGEGSRRRGVPPSWMQRQVMLAALTLAGQSGSPWPCRCCIPYSLPAQSPCTRGLVPRQPWRGLHRQPPALTRAALAPLSSGKGMVWHWERPRGLAQLPFPSFPGGFLLLWTCWMGARVSVVDLASLRVFAVMLSRLSWLLTWKMRLRW